MNQAIINIFGMPDSLEIDPSNNQMTAFFGSLAIQIPPQLKVSMPVLKIDAVLCNGVWVATSANSIGGGLTQAIQPTPAVFDHLTTHLLDKQNSIAATPAPVNTSIEAGLATPETPAPAEEKPASQPSPSGSSTPITDPVKNSFATIAKPASLSRDAKSSTGGSFGGLTRSKLVLATNNPAPRPSTPAAPAALSTKFGISRPDSPTPHTQKPSESARPKFVMNTGTNLDNSPAEWDDVPF